MISLIFLQHLPGTDTIHLNIMWSELIAESFRRLNDTTLGARIGRHIVHPPEGSNRTNIDHFCGKFEFKHPLRKFLCTHVCSFEIDGQNLEKANNGWKIVKTKGHLSIQAQDLHP